MVAITQMYDVVICGGGLAGLGLARQLKMNMPDLSVLILEKTSGEVPVSPYKVGESLDETSNFYLSKILKLESYLEENQLHKLGLRWFFSGGQLPLDTRAEIGPPEFPGVRARHVDRKALENHMVQLNRESDIKHLTGVLVKNIILSEDDSPHEVSYTQQGGNNFTVKCRWVVDATGRRRYLQSKLGLTKPGTHQANAVWWQLEGKYSLDEMSENADWLSRNNQERWLSTNHLMGDGYWVWVIPLINGNTSIGIVASEDMHPLSKHSTHKSAMKWLQEQEPHFAKFIENATAQNFLAVKDFCYDSHQVFSEKRWSCVGDSAIFTDPFYSPGVVMLSYSNCLTVKMIELDRQGQLTAEIVQQFNNLLLNDIGHNYLQIYQDNYPIFGSFNVMSIKLFWDAAYIWFFPGALFFQQHFTDPEVLSNFSRVAQRYLALNKRMQQLFRDWGEAIESQNMPCFLAYDISYKPTCLGKPRANGKRFYFDMFKEAYFGLVEKKDIQQYLADLDAQMQELERWAQVIFRHVLSQVMPEKLSEFPEPFWINIWGIGLDPEKWEEDGLFRPETEPDVDLQNYILAELPDDHYPPAAEPVSEPAAEPVAASL